jgi:hypothetical protein
VFSMAPPAAAPATNTNASTIDMIHHRGI